jgi:hypothetical protein
MGAASGYTAVLVAIERDVRRTRFALCWRGSFLMRQSFPGGGYPAFALAGFASTTPLFAGRLSSRGQPVDGSTARE